MPQLMSSVEAPSNLAQLNAGKRTFNERCEAFISRLSTRNWFWQKVCSLIWLPFAFRSGITLRRAAENRFTAVLPFTRGNRNWYNAMAGAALLGNSEVAGGMYLFGECGGDYVVVCKEMKYRFLRPCLGPAVYRVVNSDDVIFSTVSPQVHKIGPEESASITETTSTLLCAESHPIRHGGPSKFL